MPAFLADVAAWLVGFLSLPAVFVWGLVGPATFPRRTVTAERNHDPTGGRMIPYTK